MIIRARTVVSLDGPPRDNAAVAVVGNRITGLGTLAEMQALAPGDAVLDLGEQVLLPGLINAHCHLDYTMLRGAIARPQSFTAWVQRINALKRSLDGDDYLAAVGRGFAELKKWGTTSVCNIKAIPELMTRLAPAPLRTWWFYEMIDIRHRQTTEEVVAGALAFFQQRAHPLEAFGLSPHAPYTASLTLYHLAKACASAHAMPLTTHLAESAEELEMFREASGPLYEFLRGLGRPMSDCGHASPFTHLWRNGAVDGRWLLVHMNTLSEEDFAILAAQPRSAGPHLVHCPGSHEYFSHPPFPAQRLHELGVNLCLGTDSLASTDSLSLFEEMRTFADAQPWLAPEALLRMVTVHPARALGHRGELGCIRAGALADLIALPASGNLDRVHEEIVAHSAPISWTMIDGPISS